MPATEETYRSQPTLHVVFAISSIAMTLVDRLDDHGRPPPPLEAGPARVPPRSRTAKLKAAEDAEAARSRRPSTQAADRGGRRQDRGRRAARRGERQPRSAQVDDELDARSAGEFDRLDTEKRFQKAELDSQRSLYDGMIDRDEKREARDLPQHDDRRERAEAPGPDRGVREGRRRDAQAQAKKADLLGHVDDLEKEKERLDARRRAGQAAASSRRRQQYFGPLAWLRGLPGIDVAAPPTKIQQISLPDLTINYNFKDVPRYDRCTTCHQGIDRIGYDKDAEGKPMPVGLRRAPPPDRWRHGASTRRGKVVTAGLYLDGNGPHKINSFGCTICHGGQGSGTDFTYASHEPERPRGEGGVGAEAPLARDPSLGRADAAHPVPRVELPEVPPPGDRRPAGREAPGRLRADRQVRLHRLPHHRRRGVVRPRPDRRAPGRPEPRAPRLEGLAGLDRSSGSRTRTPSAPTRGCPGSTA